MKNHERAIWAGFLTSLAVLVAFPALAGSGLDDFGAAQGGGGGGAGTITEITETGDALTVTSGTGPVVDLAAASDLENLVDNWAIDSSGNATAVDGIAQTGSVSLVGGGSAAVYGYHARVYNYIGGSAAATTLTDADHSLTTITNEGGTAATSYVTLPAAVAGTRIRLVQQDGTYGLRAVAAGDDTVRYLSAVTSAAGYIETNARGTVVDLEAINSTEWIVTNLQGTLIVGP